MTTTRGRLSTRVASTSSTWPEGARRAVRRARPRMEGSRRRPMMRQPWKPRWRAASSRLAAGACSAKGDGASLGLGSAGEDARGASSGSAGRGVGGGGSGGGGAGEEAQAAMRKRGARKQRGARRDIAAKAISETAARESTAGRARTLFASSVRDGCRVRAHRGVARREEARVTSDDKTTMAG